MRRRDGRPQLSTPLQSRSHHRRIIKVGPTACASNWSTRRRRQANRPRWRVAKPKLTSSRDTPRSCQSRRACLVNLRCISTPAAAADDNPPDHHHDEVVCCCRMRETRLRQLVLRSLFQDDCGSAPGHVGDCEPARLSGSLIGGLERAGVLTRSSRNNADSTWAASRSSS